MVANGIPSSIPANRIIQSLSDLPPGGKALTPEKGALALPPEMRDSMALYGLGDGSDNNPESVWLLVADGIEGSLHYHNFRKNVTKAGYVVVTTAKMDKALMKALYEKRAGDGLEKADGNELIMYFENIIGDALREKVSDVHIEKRVNKARIRMRKHGELLEYKEMSPRYATDLCTVIYNVLAENKDIVFMEDQYQAAAVNRVLAGIEVKLRYQSLPVYPGGFDVVLRVLPIGKDDEAFVDLESLGYSAAQVKSLLDVIARPVGALIIAGTTGSGKSTTLKNLLMFTNNARGFRCKIYTIEDPPEYKIPHVSQIPVVRRANEDYSKKSPFADPLVATMRGDPDILMIGEIRDAFTGDGLKKATQSGHQVMTTVHASSALGIIERLADFGISPSVMGSPEFLAGLIYQKLLPVLCTNCSRSFADVLASGSVDKTDLELGKRLAEVADIDKDDIRVRGPGCSECGKMGVTGRTVCAEVITPDFSMLKLFREQDAIGAYEYWRSLSDHDPDSTNMLGKPALEHAIFKMRRGMVSARDVEESFGPVNGAMKMLTQMANERELKEKMRRLDRGENPDADVDPLKSGWKDFNAS